MKTRAVYYIFNTTSQPLTQHLSTHSHQDGFFWLVGLHKCSLCLCKLALVLQVHGMLQVNLRELVLHGRPGQVKGKFKCTVLSGIVNGRLQQTKLGEQFDGRVSTQVFCPQVRNLLGCIVSSIVLSYLQLR